MPIPPAGKVLSSDLLNTHTAWVKASMEIDGLMLMTMEPNIQKNLEKLGAYDMLKELKTLFAHQAEQELLQTVREFHTCKQEGQSVSSYILKMKCYIDNLECLGHAMTQNLANAKFLENSLMTQEASGSLEDLEIIQEEDTHPFVNTSLHDDDDDQEIDEPQSDIIPIRSKWIFKKKTDMDGVVHTYKARLVAKGFTQTYRVDYEETFSPVADNRDIRILCFAMKDLWEAAYVFGIKIYKDRSRRSQGASTPTEVDHMQRVPYASAVGPIMYAVRCTRPDVAFTQNTTSRFQQNLGDLHWTDVKNILKYLRNTKDMFPVYGGDVKREPRVSCYTDADDLKS
uniref:Zinc finger, CCHC-type n=1 Tax=Tanacetum cinerariifolium TaxID=118510 RepID=A0A6L2KKG3_TANCI|nr:zinc finger, CCHC-type [Tanacetum cinerariifolium]